MNDCQVLWPVCWSPSLQDFGPSARGMDRVKWLWQPAASFWPLQASIASGSGSSAYSPTSQRPHVDKGWSSCRQAFGEMKTWPNFLQSMSERGTRRSSASFPFFSTPAVLQPVELPVCLCQHHSCPLPPLQSPRGTPQLPAPLRLHRFKSWQGHLWLRGGFLVQSNWFSIGTKYKQSFRFDWRCSLVLNEVTHTCMEVDVVDSVMELTPPLLSSLRPFCFSVLSYLDIKFPTASKN